MRRKRRRIQYYGAESPRRNFKDRIWLPFVIVAVAALFLALIVGVILGNRAKNSRLFDEVHRSLADFGGVEKPQEKYGDLMSIQGDFIDFSGMDEKDCKDALKELPEGNAAVLLLYDGEGNVYFDAQLLKKSNTSFLAQGTALAESLAETIAKEERHSIAVFMTGAWSEEDEQLRILKISEEIALLREISAAGFREILIMGLPSDSDAVTAVNGYMRQASEACENSILGVAVSSSDTVSSGISRLVACTEEYADSYALDLRDVTEAQVDRYIEQNSYFLTAYRMRLMLGGAERESLVEIAEMYGIDSYLIAE